MPIIVQQDATTYSLFISVNRFTCFGWYLHASSGAHVTVSTAYGISKTVTATCHERDWTGTWHIYYFYYYYYHHHHLRHHSRRLLKLSITHIAHHEFSLNEMQITVSLYSTRCLLIDNVRIT